MGPPLAGETIHEDVIGGHPQFIIGKSATRRKRLPKRQELLLKNRDPAKVSDPGGATGRTKMWQNGGGVIGPSCRRGPTPVRIGPRDRPGTAQMWAGPIRSVWERGATRRRGLFLATVSGADRPQEPCTESVAQAPFGICGLE